MPAFARPRRYRTVNFSPWRLIFSTTHLAVVKLDEPSNQPRRKLDETRLKKEAYKKELESNGIEIHVQPRHAQLLSGLGQSRAHLSSVFQGFYKNTTKLRLIGQQCAYKTNN